MKNSSMIIQVQNINDNYISYKNIYFAYYFHLCFMFRWLFERELNF